MSVRPIVETQSMLMHAVAVLDAEQMARLLAADVRLQVLIVGYIDNVGGHPMRRVVAKMAGRSCRGAPGHTRLGTHATPALSQSDRLQAAVLVQHASPPYP